MDVLNKFNRIELLIKKIYAQNKVQYFLELKNYLVVATYLRELSFELKENKSLILKNLNDLSIKREEVLFLSIERIMNMKDLDINQKEIVLKILHQVIMLLPKLFYLEKDVALDLGRIQYAKMLEEKFIYEYLKLNNKFKILLNKEYKSFLKGVGVSDNILKIINEYKEEDKMNNLLLEKKLTNISLSKGKIFISKIMNFINEKIVKGQKKDFILYVY